MKTETDFPSADEARVRATAWALNQLTPEETAAFEAEMAADPKLAVYAGEMRQFSCLLTNKFLATDCHEQLPEDSRNRVVVALGQAPGTKSPCQCRTCLTWNRTVLSHNYWTSPSAALASAGNS